MRTSFPRPVTISGRAGTCAHRPLEVAAPRPDYVRSSNWAPMRAVADTAVLATADTALAG